MINSAIMMLEKKKYDLDEIVVYSSLVAIRTKLNPYSQKRGVLELFVREISRFGCCTYHF